MRISLKHKIKAHLATCALIGATFSGSALGAIVYSGPVNIPIPDNIDGVYFNVVTGVTGTSAGAVPGWDINPYTVVAGAFNLWGWSSQTWLSTGGVSSGPYPLALGTEIGPPDSNFFRPGGDTNIAPQVTLNSDLNFFGFRFPNEDLADQIQYGWVQIEFGATADIRTIVGYAYEDTGLPILAGDVGEPLPPEIFEDGFEEPEPPIE